MNPNAIEAVRQLLTPHAHIDQWRMEVAVAHGLVKPVGGWYYLHPVYQLTPAGEAFARSEGWVCLCPRCESVAVGYCLDCQTGIEQYGLWQGGCKCHAREVASVQPR